MSRQMKSLFMVFVILSMMSLFTAGCQVAEDGAVRLRLNPKTADSLERGGTAALGIAEILAPFVGPIGGIAAGGLAGGLALFKKFKPQLTQFQTKAEMSHTIAGVTVSALEELKKEHPDVWAEYAERIHRELSEANVDTKVLENFIRGLRGLPAKA